MRPLGPAISRLFILGHLYTYCVLQEYGSMAGRNDGRDREPVLRSPARSQVEERPFLLDRAIRLALLGWFGVAILTFLTTMAWVIWF